jgi:sugar lactone lactonase YvrE
LTLISDGLGWPNGLTVDRPAGRLYWNDGQRKTIESSDLSGQDRRVVVTEVPHPYGLVIVGTHVYWTDWRTKALHRADKIKGTDNTIIRGKLEGLMDVRSVQVRPTKTDSRNITTVTCVSFNGHTIFGSTLLILKEKSVQYPQN